MAEKAPDSKASCLTATTTIIVACVGAGATIAAALITQWARSTPTPPPTPAPTSVSVTSSQLQHTSPPGTPPAEMETPTPPPPPPAPKLEGVYTLQDQNVVPPMQATMRVTKDSEGEFSYRTDYLYYAAPQYQFWSTGTLVRGDDIWLLSMHATNEPNAMTYEDTPVRVTLNRGALVIATDDGRRMVWVKR